MRKKDKKTWQSPQERMSPVEYKIWLRMIACDDKYFSDMRFNLRQLRRFLNYWIQDDDGKLIPCVDDLPGWEDIDVSQWAIKTLRWTKFLGKCNKTNKLIILKANLSRQEQKCVILHELIHVYEVTLWERYKQILCIYFFKKLSRKFGERKLFEFIHADDSLYRFRGRYGHTVLFMLKSLDLDLRLSLCPGTIYGYERETHFNPKLDEEGKDRP